MKTPDRATVNWANELISPRQLSVADWRIIDALLDDPTMPLSALIDKTGLSPKTIRSHLDNMLRDEEVFIMPRLGSLSDAGQLVYHLSIFGHVGMPELRNVLGDALMTGRADEPELKYLLCLASDLADVTRRTKNVGKLRGVKSVNVTLNRELFPANNFVHRLVQERIRDSERSSR